jgi:hypothetical protein
MFFSFEMNNLLYEPKSNTVQIFVIWLGLKLQMCTKILPHVRVTKDWVGTGNWIY